MLSFGTHHKTPLPLKPSKETGSEEERLFFCHRCCLQLYLNGFFLYMYILFSSWLQTLGGVETARGKEGSVIQSTADAKEVFRTIGGYSWREGCGKKTKWGGWMRGLYLHRSKRPERRRSEASRCIFRADGGKCKVFVYFFFCLALNLNPKRRA